MNRLKQFVGYLLLGISLASTQSHASIIQSMTIEEIGLASGGLGTSLIRNGGGRFSFGGFQSPQSAGSIAFDSAGSADGAIIMGTSQGDLAFTLGFLFAGLQVSPNTLQGAPSGTINLGHMSLDLSNWGANVTPGLGYFSMGPDLGTLATAAAIIDPAHFFYTADWHHTITLAESPDFAGFTANWHLEGIATVPEPGTLWLLGASALGLLVSRRRKHA